MSAAELAAEIERVVASLDLGTPTARKAGRNPSWPYVPIVKVSDAGLHQTSQIKGLAYATREEAVKVAERHIEALRASLARKLATPSYRALREHYGLPREIG